MELWKFIHFYFFLNEKVRKLFENQREFLKAHAKRRMVANLLKSRFLVTQNLNEEWKVVELKLFEKLEFWKLEFWKLNFDMWGWNIEDEEMLPLG